MRGDGQQGEREEGDTLDARQAHRRLLSEMCAACCRHLHATLSAASALGSLFPCCGCIVVLFAVLCSLSCALRRCVLTSARCCSCRVSVLWLCCLCLISAAWSRRSFLVSIVSTSVSASDALVTGKQADTESSGRHQTRRNTREESKEKRTDNEGGVSQERAAVGSRAFSRFHPLQIQPGPTKQQQQRQQQQKTDSNDRRRHKTTHTRQRQHGD